MVNVGTWHYFLSPFLITRTFNFVLHEFRVANTCATLINLYNLLIQFEPPRDLWQLVSSAFGTWGFWLALATLCSWRPVEIIAGRLEGVPMISGTEMVWCFCMFLVAMTVGTWLWWLVNESHVGQSDFQCNMDFSSGWFQIFVFSISIILVGGLEHVLFFHILGIITPTDELIFFRGVGIPPTSFFIWDIFGMMIPND